MKKKLFTLLTLLLTVCSGAWGDPTYKSSFTDFTAIGGSSDKYMWLSKDNVDAASSWIVVNEATSGEIAESNTINPATESALSASTKHTYYRPKNNTKYLTIYLTNVTQVKFYAYNSSSSKPLYASINGGTLTKIGEKTGSGGPFICTISNLNASTNYAITIHGNGTEVYVTGIRVTPAASGKTALTGAWNPTSVSVAKGASAPSNPAFAMSAGTAGAEGDYTITYSEVSDENNIVTTNASTGITAISTTNAGTATIRATVALTETGAASYTLATTIYDITVTVTSPTYTITYGAGGGSGKMSATKNIAEGASQTITANAFTRTSYAFSHWTADVDVTINNATVTASSAIANGATIQNITSNITLTAQWTQNAPVITTQPANKNFNTDETASALTIEATPLTGSCTYQWYSNTSNSTSGATAIDGATSNSYTPSNATTGTTYYYCIVGDGGENTTTSSIAKVVVSTNPFPDKNYLELDGNTSHGAIAFTKSSKYNRQGNACKFNGVSFTNGLKQEGDTRTTFTTTELSTITIVQPTTSNSDKTILMKKGDGEFTVLSSWSNYTLTDESSTTSGDNQKVKIHKITDCPAGTYVIKQGDGQSYLAYVGITYTPKTGTTVHEVTTGNIFYGTTSNASGISGSGANEVTFDGIATMAGNNMQSGSVQFTINETPYTTIKAARGSTHIITPADGITITGVTLYASAIEAEKNVVIGTEGGSTTVETTGATYTTVDLATNNAGNYWFSVENTSTTYQALVVLKITYSTAESIDINVSSAGYSTLYYGKNVAIPEGVEAYYGKISGESFVMTAIEDVIPANTGVILKAAQGKYNFAVTTEDAAAIGENENDLTGSTTATTVTAVSPTYGVYTLGQNSEGIVGMRNYTGTNLRAYSAYIIKDGTNARSFISFGEGNTSTGINGIEEVAPITKTRKVVKNGRLVIETANGEFTIDGARVK